MKNIKIVGLLFSLAIGVPGVSMAGDSLCNGYQSDFLGPKVCVFEQASPVKDVQNIVNAIHTHEKDNQFGSDGYALLFKPGNYSTVSVPVGYYTQVSGLGLTPNDTTVKTVTVDASDLHGGTSLDNFWRSAENLKTTSDVVWAVSQASPLRNMHISGVLVLALGSEHYASGGFLANSAVDKGIASSGQQQWITRNTSIGRWYDSGVWNMVFVGDHNAPAGAQPNTVVASTPRIQEKPYLAFDLASQKYEVVVPVSRNNSVGEEWNRNTVIPQSQMIIAKPGMTADQINAALNNPQIQSPKALIFTPGQYDLDKTIEIKQANTVVLGLGVPVLTAKTPHISIIKTSANGVKMGGLLFEAGSNASTSSADASLLQIGSGSGAGVADSPTTLSDIYCRVGGRVAGQTDSCVTINDNFVIGDNVWLWRADHGAGAGSWTGDQANHGLIVKGANVIMYGLAVEHFKQEQVLWSGENGSTYFYQSELPYDVPGRNGTSGSFAPISASFVIQENVNKFTGYGLGIYDFFRGASQGAYAMSAIKAPNHPGISFTHMVSIKLGASYGPIHIAHMIETDDGALFGPSSADDYPKSRFEFWSGAAKTAGK